MRLNAEQQAQTYQLLEMIEVCAAEARKGLAFGMLHAANAGRPRLQLADGNGRAKPQIDFEAAANGAFNSFLQHAGQITHYGPALVPLLQAAVGQAPAETSEAEAPAPVGLITP